MRSDLKGLGLGKLMMEKIVRYARERGIGQLSGMTMPSNRGMINLAKRRLQDRYPAGRWGSQHGAVLRQLGASIKQKSAVYSHKLLILDNKNPAQMSGVFSSVVPGSVLLSWRMPHYHRRYRVSLLSSAWGQVVPRRYGRQANSSI